MSKIGEHYRELEEMGLINNGPQHPSEMEIEKEKNIKKTIKAWKKRKVKGNYLKIIGGKNND